MSHTHCWWLYLWGTLSARRYQDNSGNDPREVCFVGWEKRDNWTVWSTLKSGVACRLLYKFVIDLSNDNWVIWAGQYSKQRHSTPNLEIAFEVKETCADLHCM
jgi:hypothetical protein